MYLDAACGSSLMIRRLRVVSQCRQPMAGHICIHGVVFLVCSVQSVEAALLGGTGGNYQNMKKAAASLSRHAAGG